MENNTEIVETVTEAATEVATKKAKNPAVKCAMAIGLAGAAIGIGLFEGVKALVKRGMKAIARKKLAKQEPQETISDDDVDVFDEGIPDEEE